MLARVSRWVQRRFVVVVLVAALAGYAYPAGFAWVGWSVELPVYGDASGVVMGLGIIMLGMGMTLSWPSVRRALIRPHWILLGTAAQYVLMPLVAFLLVVVLDLPTVMAVGVILVGCCPGGTASNVIAYLARADVPLSVSVTLASTLLAPFATPLLVWFYAQKALGFYRGVTIEIPVALLMKTIVLIVVPILLGLAVKRGIWGDQELPRFERWFTLLSVVVIGLIVAFIVGQARPEGVLGYVGVLAAPVVLHNALGLGLGFGAAQVFGLPLDAVRALSIEVGMQNSGLAVALAGVLTESLAAQGTDPERLATLAMPAVLFSVWHNITGPMLASWWSRRPADTTV